MLNHKEKVIFHYEQSIEYVQSLKNLSEVEWRKPLGDEKWTIAEVIAHFEPWDEIVLEKRVPYFFTRGTLPKLSLNVDEVNREAAKYGAKHTREEVIDRFIQSRQKMIETITEIDSEDWEKTILIGGQALTIYEYFYKLAEHDEHHFKQIDDCLVDE
ncbi:DinB family protein [Bacillaceae bacterium W0354]